VGNQASQPGFSPSLLYSAAPVYREAKPNIMVLVRRCKILKVEKKISLQKEMLYSQGHSPEYRSSS
jgi:hypothetical protein